MPAAWNHRAGHYLLMLLVGILLTLPNLGAPSLWDIDEGNNAEAAREMLDSGDWIVPTFNYQLRVDKPALLYWCQAAAYRLLGVGELAARLPSALAALAAVLLTYELGRRTFDPSTGLLAGIILASTVGPCCAAHFANPDSLLNAFTLVTLLIAWRGISSGRRWFAPAAVSAGLAVLAKGPVGLVLPLAVVGVFLFWSGQLRRLRDRRLVGAVLLFLATALPWYAWVTVETKADFLRGFILRHNVERYLSPLEHHSGPPFYYGAVLAIGFAPWSAFLGLACWAALGCRARQDPIAQPDRKGLPDAYRFLWSWIGVYLVFFSLASTKLPNYILPAYAPLAVLTARFLERWRRGLLPAPAWALRFSVAVLLVVGLGSAAALLVAGGAVPVPRLAGRELPGLAPWAIVGVLPIAGGLAAGWCRRRDMRSGLVGAFAIAAVCFLGTLFSAGASAVDRHKAPRALVETAGVCQADEDMRIGCYAYFQPSLVFYCQREVRHFEDERKALAFLAGPLPAYLFVPAAEWEQLQSRVSVPYRLLARHYDLYRHCQVFVITNR
jgi:4-amino-4-deoxy-L-arabinose transferase-like glycosyltransferase